MTPSRSSRAPAAASGEATARELARRGAAVALAARRKDRLDALAQEIEDSGGRALALECDVTDQEQAKQLVSDTHEHFGRLDTVVNNAGVMLIGPIVDAPVEEWDRMIALNLQGLLYVAHAALPHLLTAAEQEPRQVADIVNISSVAGRISRSGSGVYNLTKHGVGAFSESLRQEVTGAPRARLARRARRRRHRADRPHPPGDPRARSRPASTTSSRSQSADIADAIAYIVSRPRHVAINELLIRPTEQEG